MLWRERVARWLCPEVFDEAKRAIFLLQRAEELATWCDGVPRLCGQWMKDRLFVHFMPLESYNEWARDGRLMKLERDSISEFREKLRRLNAQPNS